MDKGCPILALCLLGVFVNAGEARPLEFPPRDRAFAGDDGAEVLLGLALDVSDSLLGLILGGMAGRERKLAGLDREDGGVAERSSEEYER
jgi:hypothetical protein